MSKESLEHLSSLMDGEISRESGMFLTRRLSSDDALCETWERYHLIRDCIRQPGGKLVVSGLSEKLNAKLASEDTPTVSMRRTRQWIKPVAGLAIAASVALMAIVVTAPQQEVQPGMTADPALAQPANQPFVSPNNLPLAPVSQPVSYSSDGQSGNARLNAYLLRHNQMARTAGRQGFVSFVPIVATQDSSEDETDSPEPDSTSAGTGQEATKSK